MKNAFILLLIFASCNFQENFTDKKAVVEPKKEIEKPLGKNLITECKSIKDVVDTNNSISWANDLHENCSFEFHFNLLENKQVEVSSGAQFWLSFPYTFDSNSITIFWAIDIDAKGHHELINAINKIDKKYIGKPFMILQLENDTTLKANYPIPQIINPINKVSENNVLFPRRYFITDRMN